MSTFIFCKTLTDLLKQGTGMFYSPAGKSPLLVILFDPVAVGTTADMLDPGGVREVPADGAAEAFGEAY